MNANDNMRLKPWRIIENEWNLKGAPWSEAIGIEEVDEELAVPGIVCWFTRGWESLEAAKEVVTAHNAAISGVMHLPYHTIFE